MKENLSKVSTNYSRGLSLNASHLINENECQVAENFLFDNIAPYVREGIKVHASLPAPVVALRKFYKKTGSSYFVAFAGCKLYASNLSGQFTSVSSDPITSGDVSVAIYDDYLYMTNFSTSPKYFNGSSIDNVGLSSPTYRKQIADFESNETWFKVNLQGDFSYDKTYLHIDKGEQCIKLNASNPSVAFMVRLSTNIKLDQFASNISSTFNDLIAFTMTHEKKSNISNVNFRFTDINNNLASKDLITISSWTSTSSDSITLVYTVPKKSIATSFDWQNIGSIELSLTPTTSTQLGIVYIDNWRMVNTPPILTSISTANYSGALAYTVAIWHKHSHGGLFEKWYDAATGRSDDWTEYIYHAGYGITSAPLQDGTYYYKTTFIKRGPYNSNIESNPSNIMTSAIIITNSDIVYKNIKLTYIPIPPDNLGVEGRKIYRRRSDETDYRYVYTLADTVTTEFIDNYPVALLGEALEEDHNPPPNAKYILTASNQRTYYLNIRGTGAGMDFPSTIMWSKTYEPHYVPLNNTISITPNDGTEITGGFEFQNLVHVLKEKSLWTLDENNILRCMDNAKGCVAPKSIAIGENEVFWLSEQGIIKYSFRFENLTTGKMKSLIERLPQDYIQNAAGIYYNGFYLLAVTDEGSTVNNLVLCYDVENKTWSTFPNLNVNCWTTWQGYKDGYRLFYGNNSGLICEFMTGNYDVSTPIYSRIRTKEFGVPTPTMGFRKSYIYTENLDGQVRTLNVKPYYDFVNTSADNELVELSGTYNLTKINLPQKDDASFGSIEIITSGRYQLKQTDIYGKEETLR